MTNVNTIKEIRLYEVSLVTRPLHPEWKFNVLDGNDGREVHAATKVE